MFVTRKQYNALLEYFSQLRTEVDLLHKQMKRVQAFMDEHAENIREAEQEYVRQQKLLSEGIQNILDFDPFKSKKKEW